MLFANEHLRLAGSIPAPAHLLLFVAKYIKAGIGKSINIQSIGQQARLYGEIDDLWQTGFVHTQLSKVDDLQLSFESGFNHSLVTSKSEFII